MRALRCTRAHCGGNLYAEPYTEEADLGHDAFVGFEIKCLLCSRPWPERPYISLTEIILFWGVSPDHAARARWATLAFVWLSEKRESKEAAA